MPPHRPMPRFISNSVVYREMRTRKYTFLTVVGLAAGIIVFFFAFAAWGHPRQTVRTLKQLHIVFRHGDRTPSFYFPKDPNNDYKWPDGFGGSLTNRGKIQLYQLGSTIRNLYGAFLTDTYNASWIDVTSSYAPRAQMSAMALLAALYPPKGDQIWNENLLWQPIPVNPIPRDQDNLIACKAPCRAFTEEKLRSDVEFNSTLTAEQITLLKKLTEQTGSPMRSVADVAQLYYTLYIERDHGLPLPEWSETQFTQIVGFAVEDLAGYTRNNILKKFQAGPMITDWIEHMTDASNGRTTVKVHLYSGHDLTIFNLMRTLGQGQGLLPPEYGASLIVEYHRDDDALTAVPVDYVTLAYVNSSASNTPIKLKLPGCEVRCPLRTFVKYLTPFVIENWDEECGN